MKNVGQHYRMEVNIKINSCPNTRHHNDVWITKQEGLYAGYTNQEQLNYMGAIIDWCNAKGRNTHIFTEDSASRQMPESVPSRKLCC